MEIKRSASQPFAKKPAEWLGTVRVTYLTINGLRTVASLEFRPGPARRDDWRTA
jgi:hypothetical protein